MTLTSGLPELVDDKEDLCRFINQSSDLSRVGAKARAFMPSKKHGNTSVFRVSREASDNEILESYAHVGSNRDIKAASFVLASAVRSAKLEVEAEEPPPRHANLEGWPTNEDDLDDQKARQKDIANVLASNAKTRLFGT